MTRQPADLTQCRVRISTEAMNFAKEWGLTNEAVADVVRYPQRVEVDPTSATRNWYTERRRRGDITAVVTYPEDGIPLVWGVYINLPGEGVSSGRGSQSGGGVSKTPGSERELRQRIARNPHLKIEPGTNHDLVKAVATDRVISMLSRGNSRGEYRTHVNVYQEIRRQGFDI